MEIKYSKRSLAFTIDSDKINGIICDDKELVINLLKGNYKINCFEEEKDLLNYKHKITIIQEDFEYQFFNNTVYDYMISEINKKHLNLKDYNKKITDSLKIVGLNKIDLDRIVNTLSESEKKLLQIAIGLLSNPDVLVLDEPFKKLDFRNQRKLIVFLQIIKEKYNKKIIIITNDSDILYRYSTYLVIINNNQVICGISKDLLEDIDTLKKFKVKLPEIVEFTYLAKNKYNVKIDYHNDVRDIIKDIYKHV